MPASVTPGVVGVPVLGVLVLGVYGVYPVGIWETNEDSDDAGLVSKSP